MITTASGISLSSFAYSETSVICRIYTCEFGLNSFLIKGAKTPGNKKKLAALRPFQPVEVSHYRGKSELHLIKDIRIDNPLHQISSNPEKTCIALFLAELIQKSVVENVIDQRLFEFMLSSVRWLELSERYLNFHLQFMVQLSRYLGFFPRMGESIYTQQTGEVLIRDNTAISLVLSKLIENPSYSNDAFNITNQQRRELLRAMISYFSVNLEKPLDIKSLLVLETVFSD